MNGHQYQHPGSIAIARVTTAYGTFHLCAACVNAGHAGIKYGNPQERITTAEPQRPCDCEHNTHASRPTKE